MIAGGWDAAHARYGLDAVDLFAGPGGWDVAAERLGLDVIGVEWDDAACATRRAAGFPTLQGDVALLDPLDFKGATGLIASPPCQAWSLAGKGGGRRDKELCVRAALELAAGTDSRAELSAQCEDPRSMLVVEPVRWALTLRPEWIALEQVPPVLEMWTLFAQILNGAGYSTWAGVLEAERYGVPQTRERAILIARRSGEALPPRATHQRYVPGEPQRHDVTMFSGEVLPWVSMAEALGWAEGASPRPAPTVTGGGGAAGGVEVFASKGAREAVRRAVTFRSGPQRNAARRPFDTPAPTILFGHAANDVSWTYERPATTVACDARIAPPGHKGGTREDGTVVRSMDDAVRVTVAEAACLQSFPSDHPWRGSRTKQFEQVGNAVPPGLAEPVLRAAMGLRST